MTVLRVKDEDLGCDWDMHHQVYNGERFTGIAYYLHPNGQLGSEAEFVDGVETGVSRFWYPSGQLEGEHQISNFVVHGESREWYENGQLKRWSKAEHGYTIESKEWDADGHLLEHFVRPKDDILWRVIEANRIDGRPVPPPLQTGDH